LRELNIRVLKWLAEGKKEVQLKEIKDTFDVSEKLARELIKNLEFKKVLGPYVPMKGTLFSYFYVVCLLLMAISNHFRQEGPSKRRG
jgi:hypothetical protein